MKYFLDTESHEYKKQPTVCGIKVGKAINTIELISIGIVSEDIRELYGNPIIRENIGQLTTGKEYYAICKDFDVEAAWNSFQWEDIEQSYGYCKVKEKVKVYWLRENVLFPIFKELLIKEGFEFNTAGYSIVDMCKRWDFKTFKKLINKHGKTREQIAKEIKFYMADTENEGMLSPDDYRSQVYKGNEGVFFKDVQFYAYYADYDWVVFCWLFGRMIDLPKGFPRYCKDLKQELDIKFPNGVYQQNSESFSRDITEHPGYPKQANEHNALAEARWDKELYKFLQTL